MVIGELSKISPRETTKQQQQKNKALGEKQGQADWEFINLTQGRGMVRGDPGLFSSALLCMSAR